MTIHSVMRLTVLLLTRYVAMWPAASSWVTATADRATIRAKRAAVLPRTRPGRKVKQKCDQNLHTHATHLQAAVMRGIMRRSQ